MGNKSGSSKNKEKEEAFSTPLKKKVNSENKSANKLFSDEKIFKNIESKVIFLFFSLFH